MSSSRMLWDAKAHLYFLFRWLPPFGLVRSRERRLLRRALAQLAPAHGRVLDLATGTGDTLALLPKGPTRYAIDRSRTMLRYARRRLPHAHLVCADALMPPFRAGSFELICCIGLTEYLLEPARLMAGISECLCPGGVAVVSTSPRNLMFGLRHILGHRLHYHTPALTRAAGAEVGLSTEQVLPSFSQCLYVMRKAREPHDRVRHDEKNIEAPPREALETTAQGAKRL
ncbi:MAG: class I SAM-dependent methyltransferase [candidate division KSB1 bacterium]|nr:class I SAM-dependent methyltransferase [candidate division KSB1 bacterium]